MSRSHRLALAVTLTVALSACQPAVSLDILMSPLPASSGELRVEAAADPDSPPVLVLEQTGVPSRASSDDREDNTIYTVVINHEEVYSIWPADRELPLGWRAIGRTGLKQECLGYIEAVWTDMRPLSLRQQPERSPLVNAVRGVLSKYSPDDRARFERQLALMTEDEIWAFVQEHDRVQVR